MLIREFISIVVFGFIVGMGLLSSYYLRRLNVTALDDVDDQSGEKFIAARAYHHLRMLNDMGPKVVGSHANEVEAANYVLRAVDAIRDHPNNKQNITVDRQVVSGVNFGNAMYRSIQNVVVKIQGKSNHAMMLNCHFDSVPGSPGASDDIVMCCVMIEILKVLSHSNRVNEHSIIFLFNGSEEQDLQAAHGFITQHRWADNITGYINLESTGSGGREILFRSGPKHDWIIHMYRKSAPRPFGQCIAEELFETGVIPSATDFQIFRDDGEIPGVDFAYVEAGWRYHTRYDSIDYITRESVQYTGENILPLTVHMANSKEIGDPPEGDYAVYFDYLGLFMISYTRVVGIVINVLVSLIAIILPFIMQSRFRIVSDFRFVLVETLISFGTILISTALSFAVCYLIAVIMNAADNTMFYFNMTFLAYGVYVTAAVLVQVAVYHVIQVIRQCFRSKEDEAQYSEEIRMQVHFNGVNLFWALLVLIVTIMGYRFGYIFVIILTFSIASTFFTSLCNLFPSYNWHSWILIHIVCHTFSFMFTSYMMIQFLDLFIPITGKQLYENPDTLVALLSALGTVLCFSYFIPLTNLVKLRVSIYGILGTVFVLSIIAAFTSLGYPYSNYILEPRLQRYRVMHTKRSIYSADRTETFSDVGYLISELDRNAPRTVANSYNSSYPLQDWSSSSVCGQNHPILCGFGFPRRSEFIGRGKYLKSSIAPTVQPTEFTILNRSWEPNGNLSIHFTMNFTSLTLIYLEVDETFTFKNSTLGFNDALYENRHYKTARVTVGQANLGPLPVENFVFESVSGREISGKVATLTLINVESIFEKSEEYEEVMGQLPDYTFAFEQQVDSSTYEIAA